MKSLNIASIRRSLNTALRILCFLFLFFACVMFVLPVLFRNDIRHLKLVIEDGKNIEAAGKSEMNLAGNYPVQYSSISNFTFKNLPDQDVIAVIADSGIDENHPALEPFLWTNPWEKENGIDDDGNGCVDDIHGCNFGNFSNTGDIQDYVGHGTHVAGIIAGVPKSSVQLPENPHIRFAIAKCMPSMYYSVNCPEAVDYGVWIHQKTGLPVVVNVSLTWPVDPLGAWESAIARANKAGVMVVACAGNNYGGYMYYPANLSLEYDNVISVAAIDDDGNFGGFSSKYADIGAPGGSEIESTTIGGGMGKMCGTSMSAPTVTQIVLLLYKLDPKATPKEIKRMLFDGSDKRVDLEGVIKEGRVLNPKWTLQPLTAYAAQHGLAQ